MVHRSRHGLGAKLLFRFFIQIGEERGGIMVVGSLGQILDKVFRECKQGLIIFMALRMEFFFSRVGT